MGSDFFVENLYDTYGKKVTDLADFTTDGATITMEFPELFRVNAIPRAR